jgi:hypothetical protein
LFEQRLQARGTVGVVLAPRGRLFRVLTFTITRGKIAQVDVIADPRAFASSTLAVLDDR